MNLNHYRWFRILRFYLCDILGIHSFTIDEKGQARCIHCDHKFYAVRDKFGNIEFNTACYWWFKLWNSYEAPKKAPETLEDSSRLGEAAQAYFDVCRWIACKKCPVGSMEGLEWITQLLCNDTHIYTIQTTLIGLEKSYPEGAKDRYTITQIYESLLREKGFI